MSVLHYSNMTEQWTMDDVSDWLKRSKLDVLCARFQSKKLIFLFMMHVNAQFFVF